jgi:hypothetical protein
MQQQQVAQQQGQPRGPMPAPAGVPQPKAQPQAPMMAARGGLATIPVRGDMFEYARGGIIAFANGGTVEEKYRQESEEMGEGKRIQFSPDVQAYVKQLRASENSGQEEFAQQERQRMLKQSKELAQRPQQLEIPREASAPNANVTAETMKRVGPMTAAPYKDPRGTSADPRVSGLSEAAKQVGANVSAAPSPAPAPRPASGNQPAPSGALPARSPYFAQVNADLAKPIAAPTPAGVIAEQKALSPEVMQEEFMKKRSEEQRQRAAGERAAFERTRPSGLDDLIRVFGQAGQYKGMSGMGPAYTANQQQKRAEELAMEKRQNELMTAVDTRDYEGGKELFGARSKAMDAANKSFQERLKSRSEVLAQMAGVDQRAIDSALDRLNATQIAQLRSAAEARPSEAERIEATYTGLLAQKKPKEAEEYLERMSRIKRGGDKAEPLDAAMAKQYAESYAAALALPAGKLRDERMAGLREMEKKLKGGGGGATGGSATPLPANASPANLTVGTVYQTAKGPAKWTGTGFSPV